MKGLLLSTTFFLCTFSLIAQSPSYVDFEWDILRFGYSLSSADNQSGGLSFGGELRYNATDHFSLGLAGDGTVFGTDFDEDADLGISGSSLITGDFYLRGDSPTRAFLGVGVGIFRTGTLTIRNNGVDDIIEGTSGFGVAPRAGFEFGHIRLQGQYNWTFKEGHSNYFNLTVALTLWGGYKGDRSSSSRSPIR